MFPLLILFLFIFLLICAFVMRQICADDTDGICRDIFGAAEDEKTQYWVPNGSLLKPVKLMLECSIVGELINNLNKTTSEATQYFSQIEQSLKYVYGKKMMRPTVHLGQLKLFLSELEFVTHCLRQHTDPALFVYAGSAPSNKIMILCDMFPNIKLLLVDPNDHNVMTSQEQIVYLKTHSAGTTYGISNREYNVYVGGAVKRAQRRAITDLTRDVAEPDLDFIKTSKYRVYIFEGYMTEAIADQFKDTPCYFISDIRTNTESDLPKDVDILWNSAQQFVWLNKMKPIKCMLKFRVPYGLQTYEELEKSSHKFAEIKQARDMGLDLVEDYKNHIFRYIKSETIFLQAFAGSSSTESRLISSVYNELQEYPIQEYDDRFYYLNNISRMLTFHEHNMINKSMNIDGCNDCALMAKIYADYNTKYNLNIDGLDEIRKLMRAMGRNFRENPIHGIFYKPFENLDEVKRLELSLPLLILLQQSKDKLLRHVNK